jgi:hypothetical protein
VSAPVSADRARQYGARAKPLVCYVAVELEPASEVRKYDMRIARTLGVVHANGRDRIKDAQLIVSKRHRVSLSRVALIEWEQASAEQRAEAVMAEIVTVARMVSGAQAHRYESADQRTLSIIIRFDAGEFNV